MSGLVPKLRFKQDDGSDFPAWSSLSLASISAIIDGDRGRNYPNGDDFNSAGYCVFLNAKNVTKNGFVFQDLMYIDQIKDDELTKGKLLRNDIVLTTRGSIGHIAYFDENIPYENMRINSGMVLIRAAPMKIKPLYLYIYAASHKIQKQIQTISFGSAQPQLTVKSIKELTCVIPSIPEQQKIADFLSSVDAKIDAIKRKRDAFERYKKGLMQQIFSQKIRFKQDDGSDFPEWEEKRLGSLCSIKTGKLDANAMVSNGAFPFFTCAREVYRIDEFAFDTDALLISGNGANVGYIHQYNGKFNAYQRTYILSDFIYIYKIFLFYFLEKQLKARIYTEAKEGNTPYIVMGTLTDMCIDIPALPEQQKIADFLSSIDAKIDAIKRQVEKLEAFKKGLLQQMFV